MIGFCKDRRWWRTYEVFKATDVCTLESRNTVYITETSVNDGNHHTCSFHINVMQPLSLQKTNLFMTATIFPGRYVVVLIKSVEMLYPFGSLCDGVRREPHLFALCDKRQLVKVVHQGSVLYPDKERVLPATLSNNTNSFSFFYLSDISWTDRQVCRVEF